MRIGEVARVTGVSPATLRVWERRYGVLRPERTPGGHRVYAMADVARVRALLMRVDEGASVSAAARELIEGRPEGAAADLGAAMSKEAWQAVEAFDDAALRRAVTLAIHTIGVAAASDLVVVPVLRRLGDEWRLSTRNVAREHFASTVLRSVVLRFLPGLGAAGTGGATMRCLLFCPDGELHDLGLAMAGVALAEAGWQAIVLGAHTPLASVEAILDELRPDAVLVGAQRRGPALRLLEGWHRSSESALVLGGAGFRDDDACRVPGAVVHQGDYRLLADAVDQARQGR
jgi:MerR family transcriptional regulator, light-induced transcriptional regulator